MNPFTFDWDAPVADDERDRMLDKFADQAVRRGLTVPVLWMLEIHKPFLPVLGQLGITVSPLLATFFAGGPEEMQKVTQIMRSRANAERLIHMIERKSEELTRAARS